MKIQRNTQIPRNWTPKPQIGHLPGLKLLADRNCSIYHDLGAGVGRPLGDPLGIFGVIIRNQPPEGPPPCWAAGRAVSLRPAAPWEQQGPSVGELTRIHFEKKHRLTSNHWKISTEKICFRETPDLKTLFRMNLPIKTGTLVPTPRSVPNKSFFGSC